MCLCIGLLILVRDHQITWICILEPFVKPGIFCIIIYSNTPSISLCTLACLLVAQAVSPSFYLYFVFCLLFLTLDHFHCLTLDLADSSAYTDLPLNLSGEFLILTVFLCPNISFQCPVPLSLFLFGPSMVFLILCLSSFGFLSNLKHWFFKSSSTVSATRRLSGTVSAGLLYSFE